MSKNNSSPDRSSLRSKRMLIVLIIFSATMTLYLLVRAFASSSIVSVDIVAGDTIQQVVDETAYEDSFYQFAEDEPAEPPVEPPEEEPEEGELAKAGARYSVGCQGECKVQGFTNLDGKQNVVLENVHISNPNGKCLSINNAKNITIKNVTIGPCGTKKAVNEGYRTGMVTIKNSDTIRIERSLIEEISSGAFIENRNNAVWVDRSPNVTITDNEFKNIYSNIARKNSNYGNRAISATYGNNNFKAVHNSFYNAGRNALQYGYNKNVTGVEISYNRIEGDQVWGSDYEDMLNFYASTGTKASPIMVKGNYFRNGGPSTTGTGLIIGDGNVNEGTNAHFIIEDNVMVDPGNVGLGVAGGADLIVRNNTIYADSYPGTHEISVGMYINQFNYGPTCDRILVEGNRIFFNNKKHPSGSGVNHVWNSRTCSGATLKDNVFGDRSLSTDIWDL